MSPPTQYIQCESKKSPYGFEIFFPNGWKFLINVYTTLDDKFLFKYLQL